MLALPEPAKIPFKEGLGVNGRRYGGHGTSDSDADATRLLLPERARSTIISLLDLLYLLGLRAGGWAGGRRRRLARRSACWRKWDLANGSIAIGHSFGRMGDSQLFP